MARTNQVSNQTVVNKTSEARPVAMQEPRPQSIEMCLYVAGRAPNSQLALANLTAICGEYLSGRFQLEIVDVLATPMRAFADGILVTPSLARTDTLPQVRIIGNLSDRTSVLRALGIS